MKFQAHFVVIFSSLTLAHSAGITIFGISECKDSIDGSVKLDSNFDTEAKSLDGTLTVPFDIEEDDAFHMEVHEMVNGEWAYNTKSSDGDLCSYIKQFLDKAWSKARSASDPEIKDECRIPEGTYKWKGLKLSADDVQVPAGMEGRFKMDITVFKNDEPAICTGIDLEITL